MKHTIYAVALGIGLSLSLPGEAATRQYPVYPVQGEIALDGKMDDDAWQGAPRGTDFFPFLGAEDVQKTEFKILYDKANLYFGIRVSEADPGKQVLARQDNESVWLDDSIEIFLQPGARKYYRVGVNAAGRRSDIAVSAAVGRGSDAWVLEVRVPFASLPESPTTDKPMRGNICRNTLTRQPVRHSSWAPVDRSFHESYNFAEFRLVPAPASPDRIET